MPASNFGGSTRISQSRSTASAAYLDLAIDAPGAPPDPRRFARHRPEHLGRLETLFSAALEVLKGALMGILRLHGGCNSGHVPLSGGVSRHRAGQCFDYAVASSGSEIVSWMGSVWGVVMVLRAAMEASER